MVHSRSGQTPRCAAGPPSRRGQESGGHFLPHGNRPLGGGLYEVRTGLAQNRIARVLFYVDKKGRMVLLHGFIKKSPQTPEEDFDLARRNTSKHERGLR